MLKKTDNISGEIFKNYKVDKLIRNDDNIRVILVMNILTMIK